MSKYINLVEKTNTIEEVFKKIEKDCKPFLKHKRALWRGMGTDSDGGLRKVRKDREPLGEAMELSAFTNVFLDSKKLPNRTRSIFAVTVKHIAEDFGTSYLIFPKGNFKFVWFPEITDMNSGVFGQFRGFLEDMPDKSLLKKPYKEQVKLYREMALKEYAEKYPKVLDGMMEGFNRYILALEEYENKKFPKPDKYSEIIIECDEYYFLKSELENDGDVDFGQKAIERFNLK